MLRPLRPIADGDVTATIDPLGRVTASGYDDAGQASEGYQGQILSSTLSDGTYNCTFANLTPNSQLSYEVNVYSPTDLTVTALQDTYSVTSGGTSPSAADPADTPPGDGWYDLGSVAVSPTATTLTVYKARFPLPEPLFGRRRSW